MPRRALFLFAHQDDEYCVAPWILEELNAGSDIACLYLTDGGSRTIAATRDRETLGVLADLGVPAHAVAFLRDDAGRIADGALAESIARADRSIGDWLNSGRFTPTTIYSPSYEGGHPDHDALHLIAAAIAERYGVLDDAWHYSLYNAYRRRAPFFATMRQLPTEQPSRSARLSLKTRWHLTLLCWRYRSQWRTWAGLFPGACWERGVLGRESVVRFDPARLNRRPHDGELLYERLFGWTYERFASASQAVRGVLR